MLDKNRQIFLININLLLFSTSKQEYKKEWVISEGPKIELIF
jgi:hypothetical protein